MSQDAVLAALGSSPLTQREIAAKTDMEIKLVSHRLNALVKAGLVYKQILETRYRPFGYVRRSGIEELAVSKWPKW